jgi:GNAT superfamily N-acetyltransferase
MAQLSSGILTLLDGSKIRYRHVEPGDAAALQRFHVANSERSIYQRFFGVMPRLGDAQAAYFAAADGVDRVALVALDPETEDELIGVVRIDREPGTDRAEYAAIVADRWQGRGIGYGLTQVILAAARDRGIRTIYALVLPQNMVMLQLLRDLGVPERHRFIDGIEQIELTILPDADG